MKLLPIYLFASIILLSYSCKRTQPISDECVSMLRNAACLVDSLPDSALSIVRAMETGVSDDPQWLSEKHYITGMAKFRLWDFKGAIRELLYAEKYAEEIKNYSLLGDVRIRISELYDSLNSHNGTTGYALAAADAYTLAMDSDKTWEALDKSTDYLILLDKGCLLDSVAYEMKLRVNSNSDSMKIIRTKFVNNAANSFRNEHVNLNLINIWELSEAQISSDCYWDSLMRASGRLYTPSEVLDASAKLAQTGHEKASKTLIDAYRKYYINDTDGKGMFSLHNILPLGRPLYAFALTSSSMRKRCLPDVEREAIDFYYNEKLLHEQTIRYQRNMMLTLGAACLLLILSVSLIFMVFAQRRKRQNEELMHSALELKSSFKSTQEKWLDTLSHLCNTYFDAYPKDSERTKTANSVLKSIHEMTESEDFYPQMEHKLNLEQNNILSRLKEDMPQLREDEYRLFTLNALGLSIPTISLLLHEKRSVIYSRRVRLRAKVQESHSSLKEVYLKCLG